MLDGYNDWISTSVSGAGFVPSERYVLKSDVTSILLITASDDYASDTVKEPVHPDIASANWKVS